MFTFINVRQHISQTTYLLEFGMAGLLTALPIGFSKAVAVDHVIHVSVDGLRGDLLHDRIGNSPSLYPNFARLVNEGASTFNARTDYGDTNTIPNHTSMLTARPVFQPNGAPDTTHHGYSNNSNPEASVTLHNSGNPNVDYIASVFDVVHDNGLSTALYASKGKFVIFEQSYDATTGAPDVTGFDDGRDKIDSYVQKSTGSPFNASTLHADFISDMATSEFNYTFLHYRDPDSAGHDNGWGSAAWDTAVQNVDGYLGDLLNLVETDAGLVDDAVIIVTSDHGGIGFGHGAASFAANYTIPFFAWGVGVAQGVDLYRLNRSFRGDPGAARIDYAAGMQPIRNGDSGNLSLDLLGLGAVPGSLINHKLDLRLTPMNSDFDLDGDVDGEDAARWQQHFGFDDGADADDDGATDGADWLVWQEQYPRASATAVAIDAVPEPTSALLLICGLCCGERRRRHPKHKAVLVKSPGKMAFREWDFFR